MRVIDKMDKNSESSIKLSETSGLTLTDYALQITKNYNHGDDSEYFGYNHLRIYLSGKGCSGFNYGVQFDHKNSEDLSFVQKKGDYSIELICDKNSYEFLKGSEIDYVERDDQKGYVVNNPYHKKYRGKFYKSLSWKEKLSQMKSSSTNQKSC